MLAVRFAAILATMLLVGLAVGGCQTGADSPRDLFQKLRRAAQDHDFGKVYDLLSVESRARLDTALKQIVDRLDGDAEAKKIFGRTREQLKGMGGRSLFAAMAKTKGHDSLAEPAHADFADVTLTGDPVVTGNRAVVTVQMGKYGTRQFFAIKENGAWRLDGTGYCGTLTTPNAAPLAPVFALLILLAGIRGRHRLNVLAWSKRPACADR